MWDGTTYNNSEKLEKLQLEAARIVTGLPCFASRDSLYFETGREKLSNRRSARKLSLFYKMNNNLVPSILTDIMPAANYENNPYNLRNTNDLQVPKRRLNYSAKSFIPSTTRLWNALDLNVRNSENLKSFKNKIRQECNTAPKYFNEGNRYMNVIHTKLRHSCSSLNSDLFKINLVQSPSCSCSSPVENTYHYFFECSKYYDIRMNLFIELYRLHPDITLDILLNGSSNIEEDENRQLFLIVQNYIKQSGRFTTIT